MIPKLSDVVLMFANMNQMEMDQSVIVDCDHCVVRCPAACGDCVVSVLLGSPTEVLAFDSEERAALEALAQTGLVPPLRLVVSVPEPRSTEIEFVDRSHDAAS